MPQGTREGLDARAEPANYLFGVLPRCAKRAATWRQPCWAGHQRILPSQGGELRATECRTKFGRVLKLAHGDQQRLLIADLNSSVWHERGHFWSRAIAE